MVRANAKRQLIWSAIRKRRTFTYWDIEEDSGVNMCTIRAYIRSLVNADYLKRDDSPRKPKTRAVFVLVKDTGVDAPHINRDGSPVAWGTGHEQMWRTMKMLRTFTFKELAIHASTDEHQISPESARNYCRYLAAAGYLIRHRTVPLVYRFFNSRKTGPRPPVVQRNCQVYDPNLDEVVWRPET